MAKIMSSPSYLLSQEYLRSDDPIQVVNFPKEKKPQKPSTENERKWKKMLKDKIEFLKQLEIEFPKNGIENVVYKAKPVTKIKYPKMNMRNVYDKKVSGYKEERT
jgi:hypothetical protein